MEKLQFPRAFHFQVQVSFGIPQLEDAESSFGRTQTRVDAFLYDIRGKTTLQEFSLVLKTLNWPLGNETMGGVTVID